MAKYIMHIILCSTLVLLLPLTVACFADKIILKDGTVEISDRVWESEHYVHFILNGTQGVEIRYAKGIVARIEREQTSDSRSTLNSSAPEPAGEKPTQEIAVSHPRKPSADVQPEPAKDRSLPALPQQRLVRENRGISFYDPRRPMRYWAMRNSKHKELAAALDAMAERYGRTAQWIEAHMGQENDLGKIHARLIRQLKNEMGGVGPPEAEKLENDASQALIVEKDDNRQTPGHGDTTRSAGPAVPQVGSDKRFYDPRRTKKYWSSSSERHHTLREALDALAEHYGVTSTWIETHMGDTNNLEDIHRNIQKNLKAE